MCSSFSRVKRLMETTAHTRGILAEKKKKKRKLNIYPVREMPVARLNMLVLCYHSWDSRGKKNHRNSKYLGKLSHLCKGRGDFWRQWPPGTLGLVPIPSLPTPILAWSRIYRSGLMWDLCPRTTKTERIFPVFSMSSGEWWMLWILCWMSIFCRKNSVQSLGNSQALFSNPERGRTRWEEPSNIYIFFSFLNYFPLNPLHLMSK